jgi:amicyanin
MRGNHLQLLRTIGAAAMLVAGAIAARPLTRAPEPTAEPPAATRGVVEVEIKDFRFQTDTVRVAPGSEVRWINRDPVGHTSTAENEEWESPLLGPGESYAKRFDEKGTFSYHCTPHPFMRGVVVVASLPQHVDRHRHSEWRDRQ